MNTVARLLSVLPLPRRGGGGHSRSASFAPPERRAPASARLRVGERGRPPASLSLRDIQHTAPNTALRATLLTLATLVIVLLAWALTAQLDIVASAPGKLVPASQVKLVQAADAGIVREILVDDGDRVSAGQVLLRLDATVTGADSTQIANDLALKRITVRAIDAEVSGKTLLPVSSEPPLTFAQVQAQFTARRQALLDAIAQEAQVGLRASHDRLAAERIRDKLRETVPSYRQSAESFSKLHKEGFVGELLANDKRRELIEKEQDLKAQEATLNALDAAIAQSGRRTEQLRSGYRAELLKERVEALAIVQRLEQEQTKTGFRSQLMEVRAPQAGVVKDLAVHTRGAVVQAGAQLLQIVPSGDTLRAEALLANEDIGFVEIGQRTKLKLAAYPFQKYGMLEGKVMQISADAIDAAEAQKAMGSAVQLTYHAVIELEQQNLKLPSGRQLDIAPGMAVTAEIHQGRRTVMEYLLSPVQRVSSEAGRER